MRNISFVVVVVVALLNVLPSRADITPEPMSGGISISVPGRIKTHIGW